MRLLFRVAVASFAMACLPAIAHGADLVAAPIAHGADPVAAPIAHGADPVAAAISRFQAAFDRIDRASPDYDARRLAAIEEAVSGLPFATLEAGDALRLAVAGLGRSPAVRDRLAARLDAMQPDAPARDAERAFARVALALQGPEAAPDPSALRRLLEAALAHPGAPAVLSGAAADPALSALSGAAERVDEGHADWVPALTRLVGAVRPGVPPEAARRLAGVWEAVDGRLPEGDHLREPARRAIATALRRAAGAARGTPALRQRLSDEAARMTGPAALGRLVGARAPALDVLWSSQPRIRRLADLRGKVVALWFWATWSQPSVDAFPQLRDLAQRFRGRPFEVVAVTSPRGRWRGALAAALPGDPAASGRSMEGYMERLGATFTVLITRQDGRNPDYGVRSLPHLTLIDADGRVDLNGLQPGARVEDQAARIDRLLREVERSGG
ncbi:MAG TPA: TlpA disulfide reductase family protein [Chthonomonadales bacterium]|nr:TlpA disulfide reductase family protein [Chthonomonadales bacterium]